MVNQANHHYPDPGAAISDRMRELLARAAQDQTQEQHTQDMALDDIRQRLEGVEWVLQDVREREIGNLSLQLQGFRGQLDEMAKQPPPDWAERLAEHLDAMGEKVKPVGELPSLWADVGVVAESVDEALGKIQTVVEAGQESSRRFEDLTQRLDKLQSSIDAAAARFSRLDKALTSLDERAERIEKAIESLGERTEQAVDGVGNRIEGASGRLDGLDGRLNGTQGRLDGVDNRLDSVHERLEQLPTALEAPELHRRLNELAERPFPDHSQQLSALDERLQETESHLADVAERIGQDVRARPERGEVEETVSTIVASAQDQSSGRLAALEESVIALAEALLNRNPETPETPGTPATAKGGAGSGGGKGSTSGASPRSASESKASSPSEKSSANGKDPSGANAKASTPT